MKKLESVFRNNFYGKTLPGNFWLVSYFRLFQVYWFIIYHGGTMDIIKVSLKSNLNYYLVRETLDIHDFIVTDIYIS